MSREKDNGRLFHDQIILYLSDPFNPPYDFTRFIDVDGLLRVSVSPPDISIFISPGKQS